MCSDIDLCKNPVFFKRNRVFRVYQGGKLFSDLMGDAPEDGMEPEEWICSAVKALNDGHSDPLEGISLRREDGKPFSELITENPHEYLGARADIGVLVKYLDSAIRLPMQVHPTREFSKKHFDSPYGKAEAWLVLDTRPDACIYYGFSRNVSTDEFISAIDASLHDKDIMTSFVNRVPVHKGDVFFVDAGTIHAIGAGCLILEVQEPTDFTIQPEYWCGDYKLNNQEMYLGLDRDTAVSCFDFTRYGRQVVENGRKTPCILCQNEHVLTESLIGPNDTSCFFMNRHTVHNGEMTLDAPASIWICIEGTGSVLSENGTKPIKRGDYFFLPAAAAGKCGFISRDSAVLICCAGGQ